MNYLYGLLLASIFLFAGCQTTLQKGVKVINNSQADLSFLEGRWEANKHGWELTFNRKGQITQAQLSMGRFKVTPGEKNKIDMKFGKITTIDPGEWTIEYCDGSKELIVTIKISHFRAELNDDVIEGSSEDIFIGNIDNDQTWTADWFTFPNVTVKMMNKEVQLLDATKDQGDVSVRGTLVFKKVSGDKL